MIESAPAARATRIRYNVVALCVALAMVTYLDRACISTLAKKVRASLSLSEGFPKAGPPPGSSLKQAAWAD